MAQLGCKPRHVGNESLCSTLAYSLAEVSQYKILTDWLVPAPSANFLSPVSFTS